MRFFYMQVATNVIPFICIIYLNFIDLKRKVCRCFGGNDFSKHFVNAEVYLKKLRSIMRFRFSYSYNYFKYINLNYTIKRILAKQMFPAGA